MRHANRLGSSWFNGLECVRQNQGQTDIPLNEEGRRQARLLGDRLLQEPYRWDFAVSSGLSRAEETAKIISSM